MAHEATLAHEATRPGSQPSSKSGVKEDLATKVAVTVVALGAAFVAERALHTAWRTVRGPEPDQQADDSPMPEILVFAALSAATVAVAKTWATRKARAYLARSR